MSETDTALRDRLVELLRRIADGDREAFSTFYRLTSSKLFGVALRISRRRELAEEAMQEAFVQVWRMSAGYDRSMGSPITWAAAIVRNKTIDILRRADEKLAARRPSVGEEDDALAGIADASVDPDTADHLRQLERCLKDLSAEHGRMVLLAYYDGWSREELAERFAREVATVKTILRRALLKLKACMDG